MKPTLQQQLRKVGVNKWLSFARWVKQSHLKIAPQLKNAKRQTAVKITVYTNTHCNIQIHPRISRKVTRNNRTYWKVRSILGHEETRVYLSDTCQECIPKSLSQIMDSNSFFTHRCGKAFGTRHHIASRRGTYVSKSACLHSTHIRFDTCRCGSRRCWHKCGGNCGLERMNLKLGEGKI